MQCNVVAPQSQAVKLTSAGLHCWQRAAFSKVAARPQGWIPNGDHVLFTPRRDNSKGNIIDISGPI